MFDDLFDERNRGRNLVVAMIVLFLIMFSCWVVSFVATYTMNKSIYNDCIQRQQKDSIDGGHKRKL